MRTTILAAVALAACASVPPEQRAQNDLAHDLSTRVAGETRSCISADRSAALVAVDERTVTYRQGSRLWVSRLAGRCPGLDSYSTLIVEVHGDRYCRGDRFRALEHGLSIPGPYCFLGDFTEYRSRR